jgi:hypothetical protein
MTEIKRLYGRDAAALYCGFIDTDDKDYFWSLHKEGRGPSFVRPSARKIFFTQESLDRWIAAWQVTERWY